MEHEVGLAVGVHTFPKGERAMATRREASSRTKARYVRRNKKGQFKEIDDVGRSLAQDRRRKAKTAAPRGQGDRGRSIREGVSRGSRQLTFQDVLWTSRADPARRCGHEPSCLSILADSSRRMVGNWPRATQI
jgi:hypothetical protein